MIVSLSSSKAVTVTTTDDCGRNGSTSDPGLYPWTSRSGITGTEEWGEGHREKDRNREEREERGGRETEGELYYVA